MSGVVFNANEVFEMAKRIEINGGKFYRQGAEANPDVRELFLRLAQQEDRHLATFVEMQQALSPREAESTAADPDDEADLYLKAMADGHVFVAGKPLDKALKPGMDTGELIEFAFGIEKDSIVFYLHMKEMVPRRLGMERIDGIIREEMRHIAWLNDYLGRTNAL